MNPDHVVFEIASKYCILDSFVDYNGFLGFFLIEVKTMYNIILV